MAETEASIPVGTLVGGRWRITGILGAGGFGQVLAAEDASEVALGRAAVKVLHPNTTPQERRDFLAEVKKIAVLRHQNLVGYLDSGQLTFDGIDLPDRGGEIRPYLVTELCERSLDDHLAASSGGVLSVAETYLVLGHIADGLIHLHERGLIHRDIKPGNTLYADGRWKLADFGLMRDLSASGAYHRGELLIGTPLFMAPELFTTMMATAASDVYALGVLAHLCCTGNPLHRGAGPALMHNVATQTPTIDPSIDAGLANLIARCSAADPDSRPSATELGRYLSAGRWAQPVISRSPPQPATRDSRPPPPVSDRSPSHRPQPVAHSVSAHRVQPLPSSRPFPWLIAGGVLAAGLVLAGAIVGFSLLSARAATDRVQGAESPSPPRSEPATGSDTDVAASDEADDMASDPASDSGVTIGENVEIGPGVVIGSDRPDSGDAAAAVPLTEAETHLADVPCRGVGEPHGVDVDQILVTNLHDAPVDYRLTIYHYDDAGVRIAESFDTARALPPGSSTSLGLGSTEDGAVSCAVSDFSVFPTAPALVADIGQAEIGACEFNEFFGNAYDIIYTVNNPLAETAELETGFAVVGADGIRIDESFSDSVYGVQPGERVQRETHQTFWNMDDFGQAPVECVVIWVEVSPE